MDGETLLIILGGLLLAIGILGGGFSIKELKVPTVGMGPRVIAFVIGVALIGFGANLPKSARPTEPLAGSRRSPCPLTHAGRPFGCN